MSTKPSISEVYMEAEDIFAADVSFVVELLQSITGTVADLITDIDDTYIVDFNLT